MTQSPTQKDEMLFQQTLLQAADESAKLGYNPTRMRQMIASQGAFTTAREVLQPGTRAEGFQQMASLGRLDLTVECIVQDPMWSGFFTAAEMAVAKQWTQGAC